MTKRNNLSPAVWGPKTWFFLESVALGYPEEPSEDEKFSAKQLVIGLQHILPCHKCRVHYSEFLHDYIKHTSVDEIVKNRHTLIEYIVAVHNNVSIINKKEPRKIEDVFLYYKNAYSVGNTSNTNIKENFQENNKDVKEDFKNNMYYHFNPITLFTGIVVGLIVHKLYMSSLKQE